MSRGLGVLREYLSLSFSNVQFSTDVLACNLNPTTGMVEALDAWNPASRNNIVDNDQDVFLFSGTSAGGRITCT